MSMIRDLEQIVSTVLATDPSFRSVRQEAVDQAIQAARQSANAPSKDAFLLSLMGLMALPVNGHTRLIPNDAISILPLRFVTIGSAVHLLDAAPDFSDAIGGALLSINGVPVQKITVAAQTLLAGTQQRKRVIGPILFAWPSALQHLGVSLDDSTIEYQIGATAGRPHKLLVDRTNVVPGSMFYPRSEHGKANASWSPTSFVHINDFGQIGKRVVLPSFFDTSETGLKTEISEAAERVRSRPGVPLLIDVRGNTGGDFLRTMPLIDAISEDADVRRVGVLVDKFTFSAAIVFVAILKHRLGDKLMLIGEEMGDGLTFFAEGGTMDLPSSGACIRYSTAFHDWAEGRTDATTPAEIAEKIVPVGTLKLDRRLVARSDAPETQDPLYRDILESLAP